MRTKGFVSIVLIAGLLFTSCVGGGAARREDVAQITPGMTEQQVVEKLGNPWDINTTNTRRGTREQWVYKEAWSQYGQLYIYFENGTVESTQY